MIFRMRRLTLLATLAITLAACGAAPAAQLPTATAPAPTVAPTAVPTAVPTSVAATGPISVTAHPALVAAADLVTEMRAVKHPFAEQGIRAQKGIEF